MPQDSNRVPDGMNPDSSRPDSPNNDSETDGLPSDPGISPRLLANEQALVDRLFAEAAEHSWSLTRQRFESSLERSAAKRFGSDSPRSEKIAEYLGALHLEDLCLATACAAGHAEAWEHFVRTYRSYLRSAAAAILRCSASSPAALDLADSLFAELYGLGEAKRGERSLFRYFQGRSSLRTWLRAVLAQRHIDAIRSGRRFTHIDDETDPARRERILSQHSDGQGRIQSPPDPHRERYGALFTRTLQAALRLLDPRDSERLRLYYAEEQTLAEIGRKLGEHESSVSRNLDRIRRDLRTQVESVLRKGRVAANGIQTEAGLSDEQISVCFEYASEDAPINLDKLFPSRGPGKARLEP
jgi:RNA polymerase sigma factor (sigma-70 family)